MNLGLFRISRRLLGNSQQDPQLLLLHLRRVLCRLGCLLSFLVDVSVCVRALEVDYHAKWLQLNVFHFGKQLLEIILFIPLINFYPRFPLIFSARRKLRSDPPPVALGSGDTGHLGRMTMFLHLWSLRTGI